jgi:hypothetical protein
MEIEEQTTQWPAEDWLDTIKQHIVIKITHLVSTNLSILSLSLSLSLSELNKN